MTSQAAADVIGLRHRQEVMQRMSERAEPAACAVSPVGAVSRCRGRTSIHIAPPYRPALHLLGEFSHALVVFPAAGASAKRREPAALVRVGVARIIRVDESSGVLEIDRIDAADRTSVWDVKPYFPIEDRVRDCITRGAAAKSPPWRPETSAAEIRKDTDRAGSSRSRPPRISSAPVSLSFAGIVRAGTGEFRLELPGLGAGAWKALGRSSHVRVVWWFDRFDKPAYRKTTQCNPPYENAPRTGVFASRSPVRPNPIGIDTARIVSADAKARVLTVVGMESMDRTPVLDVHPYLPWLDRVEHPVTPVWVRHWPQWKPEDAGAAAVSPDRIKVSDASRLSSLMPSGSRDTRRVISDSATDSPPIQTDSIQVTGARQNNLRGLSCDIPIRKITVITGVSGSGKSSLAFDTLYAESHRRFLDSVSTAGRQAFEQFERPDVENIGNLPPAVAIEQKSIGRNPRSTVGTMTEIYDYLRLLFARLGTRHCPDCGRAVEPLAPDDISRRLAALAPGTPFTIRPHETDGPEAAFVAPPQPSKAHARAVMSAVKAALDAGHGALCARVGDRDFLLHSRQCCFFCRRPFLTLMSSAFSYNHPAGMCPDCHGLCVRLTTDPGLIVTDPDKSVLDGASPWWADLRKHLKRPNANWMKTEVFALAASMGVDLELPWAQLPEEFRRCALFGTGGEAVRYRFTMSSGRRGVTRRPVAGAVANINRLFRETSSESTRDFYLRFMSEQPCETCCGERLAPEGRLTTLAGRRYPEAAGMSVAGLRGWVDGLSESLDATRLEVGADILRELRRRLRSLASVGVDYLTLDRSAPTLSGGEAQRIRLAAQLGGGLTGLLYVLDEPSIGLHPHDHGRMLDYLRRLRDAGNTVVVVEHDADTMRAADRLIDIGPGAGENGGRLVAEGTPDEMIRNPASLTGRYLSGQLRVADPRPARRPPAGWLTLAGARLHTLRGVTARIPLGVITCVTGVSGSGKSSLIARTLHPALARALHHSGDAPGPFDRLEGIE